MSTIHTIDSAIISDLQIQLQQHPLYTDIKTTHSLKIFMSHHIYSVWDFMSLLKYLQHVLAPSSVPWIPRGNPNVRGFINQIVLGEESDIGLPDANNKETYISHFELYCAAMREIGADPSVAIQFINIAIAQGIDTALTSNLAPPAAQTFMRSTFEFIHTNKPHVIAAVFAFGREHIIPNMFRALLAKMSITAAQAPAFHYYLERHIHLDETSHAPLALQMVNELIGNDAIKAQEAIQAAQLAVQARLQFWDGIKIALNAAR